MWQMLEETSMPVGVLYQYPGATNSTRFIKKWLKHAQALCTPVWQPLSS
jgi:hypothetical protein